MMENVVEMKTAENVCKDAEQENVLETVGRPFTLRKLKDRDLFPLLKILRKIGLKEFKEAFNQIAEGQSLQSVGVSVILDIAGTITEHIGAVEDDLYSLYADVSGIPAEEIKEMEFGTLPLMIFDSFGEVKNTSFFKVLSRLL